MSSTFSVLGQALRKRIERLEELLELVRVIASGAAAAAALTSFAGPIVADQATASALPASTYITARQVYTLSQEAIWQYIPGVPGAIGVPPLVADEVIAASGGVLARTAYSSPEWRTGVNDIWIDPGNPAASDENDGFTALTPLKTGYELFRRWGWSVGKPVVGANQSTSPDGFVNIHVVSDIASPDSLPIKITIAANSSLRIIGETITVIRTATLTAGPTPMNRAVPAPGGTRLAVSDNTLVSWAAFEVPNRRVQMMDGPAATGTFQPQTDSLIAPGTVQCSACQTTNEPGFSLIATTVTPAAGNTYQVQQLTVVNLGQVDISAELNDLFGGFNAAVNLVNINLPAVGAQSWLPLTDTGADGIQLNFYQCTIDRTVDVSRAACLFIACYGTNSIVGINGCGFNGVFNGGGWNEVGGSRYSCIIHSNVFDSIVTGDTVFNLCTLLSMTGPVGNFASWNGRTEAGANVAGHGFIVGGGGSAIFYGYKGNTTFKGTLWGQGAGGAGCLISASCSGVGAPQNITGTLGDFQLANKLVGWWWNDATAVYNPAGAGIVTLWANLAAAEGAAGFGGNAHELDSNSHFVAAETTA